MDGFVAVLNTNGAPVDGWLLRTMLDVTPFDPSRAIAWTSDAVGLASTPFRSPTCLDPIPAMVHGNRLTIVMDGRLDDRSALVRQLEADLGRPLTASSDADLVIAAYQRWGIECAAHLLGDFSFCIWDAERQQLVCARDHFGVKPFYYARVGAAIVVSNVLRSIRRYPGVSARLDDVAVGDVLLFGLAMDLSRSMFADVSRLPPGHVLVSSRCGERRLFRYWALEPGETRHYRNDHEPVEEFASALRVAVADRLSVGRADRLPGSRIAVLMSGGLDSSSVAAVAAEVLGPSAPESLRAVTGIYETVAADEERHYSSLVAASLNIAIEHLPFDRYKMFDGWDNGALPPEPTTEPMTAATAGLLARVSAHGAHVLTGDGGDPLLLPSTLIGQLGRVPFHRLMSGFWSSLCAQVRPPIGLRSSLRRHVQASTDVPAWFAEPLRRSFDARSRWAEIGAGRSADRGSRSAAVNSVIDPWWPSTFETYDPSAIGQPVEMRYPFFDIRLVGVALGLASFPFCVNKQVLRRAMRGRLPDAIVQRPKTPLAVQPEAFHSQWSVSDAVQAIAAAPGIEQYVDIQKFEAAVRPESLFTDRSRGTLAAVSLAMWLRHSAPTAVSA
jgi:asparagine synthase (glutamine-hydrolysing)